MLSEEGGMAHRYGHAITVTLRRGRPVAFVWRGLEYDVRVIGRWKLQDRWWDPIGHADRTYWRVITPALGVYELLCENGVRWVLDVVQD
jgi:hypothetical protein